MDAFILRLGKHLCHDPTLGTLNIWGVGYKLITWVSGPQKI